MMIKCKRCEKEFTRKRSHQKFCSKRCQMKDSSKKRGLALKKILKAIRDKLICQNCGNRIKNARANNQKFCGLDCSKEFYRIRAVRRNYHRLYNIERCKDPEYKESKKEYQKQYRLKIKDKLHDLEIIENRSNENKRYFKREARRTKMLKIEKYRKYKYTRTNVIRLLKKEGRLEYISEKTHIPSYLLKRYPITAIQFQKIEMYL